MGDRQTACREKRVAPLLRDHDLRCIGSTTTAPLWTRRSQIHNNNSSGEIPQWRDRPQFRSTRFTERPRPTGVLLPGAIPARATMRGGGKRPNFDTKPVPRRAGPLAPRCTTTLVLPPDKKKIGPPRRLYSAISPPRPNGVATQTTSGTDGNLRHPGPARRHWGPAFTESIATNGDDRPSIRTPTATHPAPRRPVRTHSLLDLRPGGGQRGVMPVIVLRT